MSNVKDKVPGYDNLVIPYHVMQGVVGAVRYGFPGKKMTVIGVTGTNGKTTTCFMIWKMLNSAGMKAGLMTTVAWGVERLHKQIEHMTTVDAQTLNKRMDEIRRLGAKYLVLEVTSHAMAQHRTLGVPIDLAVMTNVTHEHLDYHKTFERYRDAKRKLFKKAKFGVVNADDASGIWFMQDVKHYITYGIKHGQLRADKIKLSPDLVKYSCGDIKLNEKADNISAEKMDVTVNIPGEFNVYNSLAAVCVGLKLGLSERQIVDGLFSLDEVEGRMNKVDAGQDYTVIVDYAHTPDAFKKVFGSVCLPKKKRGKRGRRVITVTGGAGRRDESTRAERGEIAARYSDVLIVTEDDSRDEDPREIAEEFVKGAEKEGMTEGEDVLVELDRRAAIEAAVAMARKGDLILILGKGHEKTILRANGAHNFEDLKVTRRAIERRMRAERKASGKVGGEGGGGKNK